MKLAQFLALSLALAASFSHAAALDEPAARGREFYRNGQPGQFACAGCHGMRGEGRREGGVSAPPLRHTGSAERDGAGLRRAITEGTGGGGRALHPLMPRYRLEGKALDDLVAYLDVLGSGVDDDPGIGNGTLRIAAVLPSDSTGAEVRRVLDSRFADINASGGIYGRRLELVADPASGEEPFAFVASLASNPDTPSIGPLTPAPPARVPPDRWVFHLLPSLRDQARVLVDYAARIAASPTLNVVYEEDAVMIDALIAVRAQARLHSILIKEQVYAAGAVPAGKDGIIFLGSGPHLLALGEALERTSSEAPVYASAMTAGPAVFRLPPARAARLHLAYPAPLSSRTAAAGGLSSAYQRVAQAAATVLIEALKRSGRQLSREKLVQSLEQLRDFPAGALAPVSFTPNRRAGTLGAYMVGIDVEREIYVPHSSWLTPLEKAER